MALEQPLSTGIAIASETDISRSHEEPRQAFRASIPLVAMWIVARAMHFGNGYREPHQAQVMAFANFARLCATPPWKKCECWRDRRYQYALCEKA